MFMILAVPWAAAADDATGCDVAPTEAIVRGSEAGPIVGVDGEEWRMLGRAADPSAWVVACRRGPASTADTIERQWLVERVGAEPPVAVSIGVRLDSSFEERFTGPVRVARSRRIPASIPAWEVCGPWESGDTGDGARSKEGCRLVVSPVAARGVEPGEGHRVITFIAAGEHPFMQFMAWFDTRSRWSAWPPRPRKVQALECQSHRYCGSRSDRGPANSKHIVRTMVQFMMRLTVRTARNK